MRCCIVVSCEEPHYGLGYCKSHYSKFKRHGTAEPPPKLPKQPPDPEVVRAQHRERNRRYRAAHPEKIKQFGDAFRQRNPAHAKALGRKSHLKRYGISLEEYQHLHDAQNGLCAICGLPESVVIKGTLSLLRVDHNHKTGHVRELLCNQCNLRVGRLLEDEEWTSKAMAYLQKHDLMLENDDTPKGLAA